jgi:ferrous iron transport protein B
VHELACQVVDGSPAPFLSLSDRIDRIVTHKWLGIPIFLALMYMVFNLVQNVSAPYLDYIDGLINGPLTRWVTAILSLLRSPGWLISLITDGVMAGVGGVLVFLPGLLVMYMALAALEESGYLARAAFVTDRIMSKLGLHGRSFVPMILGFGCNVPAIYATRSIESKQARLLTGLLIPFMSCSARLPVYVIFGLAFFPQNGDFVIWALYMLGITMAAVVGIILSNTVFKGSPPGILIMEMPAYRLPSIKRMTAYAWEQSASFIRKAGTFILAGTVVFWALLHLPWGVDMARDSYFGQVSQAAAPLFGPAGFGEWEQSGALLTGMLAKEMVVSTLSQVYVGEAADPSEGEPGLDLASFSNDVRQIVIGMAATTVEAGKQLVETFTPGFSIFKEGKVDENTALAVALQSAFSPLSALAFLVFVLMYIPCIATVSAQIQEFGWRWALFSALMMLLVPWLLATAVYQLGRLAGFA